MEYFSDVGISEDWNWMRLGCLLFGIFREVFFRRNATHCVVFVVVAVAKRAMIPRIVRNNGRGEFLGRFMISLVVIIAPPHLMLADD